MQHFSFLCAILIVSYNKGELSMARKNIRLQYNAPVTLTFFFLSLTSLVLGYLTNNWTTSHLFSEYHSSMTDPLFYVRLFGHVLGHGGWDHFINNMLLFLVVAPPLEERYGSRTLLSGILMTALVSAYCSACCSLPPHCLVHLVLYSCLSCSPAWQAVRMAGFPLPSS